MQGNIPYLRRINDLQKGLKILPIMALVLMLFINFNAFGAKHKHIHKHSGSRVYPVKIKSKVLNPSVNALKPLNLDNYNTGSGSFFKEEGYSSCYGRKFNNRRTSSGEMYLSDGYSAAHRNAPFGTILRVTNLSSGSATLVRVNDRGPYVRKRIIDISYSAAKDINAAGTPKVKVEGIKPDLIKCVNDDSYLCYSFNLPLISLTSQSLEILKTFSDFNEALNYYKKVVSDTPDRYVFLTVPTSLSSSTEPVFSISFFKSDKEIINNDEVAKDLEEDIN